MAKPQTTVHEGAATDTASTGAAQRLSTTPSDTPPLSELLEQYRQALKTQQPGQDLSRIRALISQRMAEAALSDDEIEEIESSTNNRIVSYSPSQAQRTQHSASPTPKLRSARDVLHKLLWDPSFEADDYVVVYEDRFVGEMEKRIREWRREQTDEEFIPESRVVKFKRISSGEVVWDRRLKADSVFGSGYGSSAG